MPHTDMPDDRPLVTDDAAAFAASPPSVAPALVQPSVSPSQTRKCEGCARAHPGSYGSGRFCSATCAKKVGARHKWAARAAAPGTARRATPRRALPDAPCESCTKKHDKSYGSGRFCSVHCARRVAATRKWEKSRTEKSKRLEAIRPAMLAPPPCAIPVLAGKRRRVVGRQFEQLHISDTLYLQQHQSAVYSQWDSRNHPSQRPSTPVVPVAQIPPTYQNPYPHPPPHPFQISLMSPPVVFANHNNHSSAPTNLPRSPLFYAPSPLPSYGLLHPNPTAPSSHPPTSRVQLHYAPAPASHSYPLNKTQPLFEVETVSSSASPPPSDDTPIATLQHNANPSRDRKAPVLETSESAARALLCLRATSP